MSRWEAFKAALKAAWRAWCRVRPLSVKVVKIGIPDPALARTDSGVGDPELQIPADETQDVLYKDGFGNYFTETELRLGLRRPQGHFVFAFECNDETAQDLVDRLEAVSLDTELLPAEKVLLAKLKKNLLERDV